MLWPTGGSQDGQFLAGAVFALGSATTCAHVVLALSLAAGLGIDRFAGCKVTVAATVGAVLLAVCSFTFGQGFPLFLAVLGGTEGLVPKAGVELLPSLFGRGLLTASVLLVAVAFLALWPAP